MGRILRRPADSSIHEVHGMITVSKQMLAFLALVERVARSDSRTPRVQPSGLNAWTSGSQYRDQHGRCPVPTPRFDVCSCGMWCVRAEPRFRRPERGGAAVAAARRPWAQTRYKRAVSMLNARVITLR